MKHQGTNKRIKKGIAAASLLTGMMLTACGGNTATQGNGTGNSKDAKPIKIGVLVDKTGKGADWGKKQEIAANIAADEINAAGGINGSKIELIFKDTGGKNEAAVKLTRDLDQEKVAAIAGPFFSGECEVAFPVANQLKVPIISASSAKPGVSANNRPWAFRNSMTDDKLLNNAIPKFVKQFNVKTIAIVHDEQDAWSKSVGTALFPQIIKKNNVQILNQNDLITFKTGTTDFSAAVTKLKSLNPDAIAFGGLYGEAASFAKEMERQGFKKPVIGGVGMYSAALIQQGGKSVENFVATADWNPDKPDPKVKTFVEKFTPIAQKITPADPSPGHFEANMYETIHVMAETLKKANKNGSTDLADLRETIKQGWSTLKGYPGITGTFNIDSAGDGDKENYPLIIKNGKYEILN